MSLPSPPLKTLLLASAVLCTAFVSARVAPPDVTVNESRAVVDSVTVFPPLSIVIVGAAGDKCREDSRTLLDNLRNSTTWAMQMYDASAKGAVGQLLGSAHQLGNFHECVRTVTPIRAQYCLVSLTIEPGPSVQPSDTADEFYNPFGSVWNKIWHIGDATRTPRNSVHQALCVPASCSHADVRASVSRHLDVSPLNYSVSVEVHPSSCQTDRSEEALSTGSIIYCSVMAIFLIIVVLSTILDRNIYFSDNKDKQNVEGNCPLKCSTFFSLKRSVYTLCKHSNSSIKCIDGFKVVSTFVVILSHRSLVLLIHPFTNYEVFEKVKFNFIAGIFMQAEVTVDTFFSISGLLLTYTLMSISQKKIVNPMLVLIQRYTRLTPVYAVILFFYYTVMFHVGEGPLWGPTMSKERQYCQENWWTNLLYINNYVNEDRMCMIHSWYLAADFHCCVVSIILVYLLLRCHLLGHVMLGLALVASFTAPLATTYLKHLDPLQLYDNDFFKNFRTQPYLRLMYIKTHVHVTPYLVGIIAGLVLFHNKSRFGQYTWQARVGFAAGCVLCIASLIPGCFMSSHTWKYNDIEAALEEPQRRLFWPLGVVLMLISLIFSKQFVIAKFLSHHVFTVMSRLCFTSYLCSLPIQLMMEASRSTVQPLTWYTCLISTLSDLLLTFFVSFILYVMIECPFESLIKKALAKDGKGK